jgi:hypothetical protein
MQQADRIPVMVVSHERSGTHFLMNALAAEFGFVSHPPVTLDRPVLSTNFFSPDALAAFFHKNRDRKVDVIRKSHHQYAFFESRIEGIVKDVKIFYIYRDPRDVTHSFRHFLNSWRWFEGPRIAEPGAFIRAAPAGQMLRYQYHQLPDMLDRWRVHVEGWLDAAARFPAITAVRYEELDADYDMMLDRIALENGWTRRHGPRPGIDENTILKSRRDPRTDVYTEADLAFFRTRIGPTMRRLGYDI